MRRILLFALLLLPQLLQAQEVFSRPIAEDHKVWRHENMELPGNRTRLTYTEGDTILANQHYFKYYTCNIQRELRRRHPARDVALPSPDAC